MRVLHRVADRAKQFQACWLGKFLLFAVRRDGRTCDIFQHDVMPPVGGRATIQQPRNIWMFEPRQNLSFLAKALHNLITTNAGPDEFDRHLFMKSFVHPMRQKHRAHAAPPDLADDLIRPDPTPGCHLGIAG